MCVTAIRARQLILKIPTVGLVIMFFPLRHEHDLTVLPFAKAVKIPVQSWKGLLEFLNILKCKSLYSVLQTEYFPIYFATSLLCTDTPRAP